MTDTTQPVTHMHHVFVDFENVQTVDLSVLGSKGVNFTLLLGAKQTKLNVALVEKLLEYAAAVQLIRLATSGRNALDFALAYYVGQSVLSDPAGHFHIISKDAGYDPLIEHPRSRHIHIRRHVDCSTLPFVSVTKPVTVPRPSPPPKPASQLPAVSHPVASTSPHENLETRVLAHLRKNTKARPKRKKTLVNLLTVLCGKSATEAEVLNLIERLHTAGHIILSDKGAVTYRMDNA